MSLQDESFPDDLFRDEFNFPDSGGSGEQRFQFPNVKREKNDCEIKEEHELKQPTTSTSTNTSASSNDQNLSSESSNGRPPSELSSKTTESDPTGLATVSKKIAANFAEVSGQTKSVSYNDILYNHSEYTKRRYKHVESKVGQYIANMKAEDEKRRNAVKFQRHRSMPETLSTGVVVSKSSIATGISTKIPGLMHYSANELHKMNESITSELISDSAENITGPGSTTNGRHESSENLIDKMIYNELANEKERIQSYSDYLQLKLDEKIGENMRLKRNVDFMRIELGNCKDKLKRQQSSHPLNVGSIGSLNGGASYAKKQPFQILFNEAMLCTKATQTDFLVMKPLAATDAVIGSDVFITPTTPFCNPHNKHFFEATAFAGEFVKGRNSKIGKNIVTIQPIALNFSNIAEQDNSIDGSNNNNNNNNNSPNNVSSVLRQRSNSNSNILTAQMKISINNKNNGKHISCSNADTAIDIDAIVLASPKNKRNNKMLRSSTPPPPRPPLPARAHEDEFIYYDKRSGRFSTLETLNASSSGYDENYEINGTAVTTTNNRRGGGKKRINLRKRWLSIFGSCLRCDEPNQVLENNNNNNAIQQSYTQVPLLEESFSNHCRNLS